MKKYSESHTEKPKKAVGAVMKQPFLSASWLRKDDGSYTVFFLDEGYVIAEKNGLESEGAAKLEAQKFIMGEPKYFVAIH